MIVEHGKWPNKQIFENTHNTNAIHVSQVNGQKV